MANTKKTDQSPASAYFDENGELIFTAHDQKTEGFISVPVTQSESLNTKTSNTKTYTIPIGHAEFPEKEPMKPLIIEKRESLNQKHRADTGTFQYLPG